MNYIEQITFRISYLGTKFELIATSKEEIALSLRELKQTSTGNVSCEVTCFQCLFETHVDVNHILYSNS